jgi:plastocyanin
MQTEKACSRPVQSYTAQDRAPRVEVTFPEPGTFGFSCSQDAEMQGAISVVP